MGKESEKNIPYTYRQIFMHIDKIVLNIHFFQAEHLELSDFPHMTNSPIPESSPWSFIKLVASMSIYCLYWRPQKLDLEFQMKSASLHFAR